MPRLLNRQLAAAFRAARGSYSPEAGFGSVERRSTPAVCDWERMYAQSAPGKRSSHRTSPPDSRSRRMHSSARNDWLRLAALRRYPSLVPHAATYAARASFESELRYLSNLSMPLIYPQVKSESIPIGHLPTSKLLFECRMDKYEVRRLNLEALIDSRCGGRSATLADLIETSPSYISRMLYPEGKKGRKRIGEDMRDRIEDALSLKRGSLDEEVREFERPTSEAESTAAPTVHGGSLATPQAAQELAVETTLERLDAPEKAILELYRRATDKGKLMIKGVALKAPKTDG